MKIYKHVNTQKGFKYLWCTLLILWIFLMVLVPPASLSNLRVDSNETSTIPTIDGVLAPGEWDDARIYNMFFTPLPPHPADNISILIKNDLTHLYIAFDVQPDNTTESSDTGWIFLDLNRNGTRDLYFRADRGGFHGCWHETLGNLTALSWNYAFGNTTSPLEPSRNHTTIEWVIPINLTAPYVGQNLLGSVKLPVAVSPMGVVFAGYGTLAPQWYFGNTTNDQADKTTNASFYSAFYLNFPDTPPIPGFAGWALLFGLLGLTMKSLWKINREEL